jgi:hypothetical protein
MAEKINAQKAYQSTAGGTVSENSEMERRKTFSQREVGLTHPDNSSFIRLSDAGDIEIFAAPGVGIVISASSRSISLFAESIKFFTNEDGLKWNSMEFNHSATSFAEPALVNADSKSYNPAYMNVDFFIENLQKLEEEQTQQTVTINGSYDYSLTNDKTVVKESFANEDIIFQNYTNQEIDSIKTFWTDNNSRFNTLFKNGLRALVDLISSYKSQGYTLDQAKNKILNDTKG